MINHIPFERAGGNWDTKDLSQKGFGFTMNMHKALTYRKLKTFHVCWDPKLTYLKSHNTVHAQTYIFVFGIVYLKMMVFFLGFCT